MDRFLKESEGIDDNETASVKKAALVRNVKGGLGITTSRLYPCSCSRRSKATDRQLTWSCSRWSEAIGRQLPWSRSRETPEQELPCR